MSNLSLKDEPLLGPQDSILRTQETMITPQWGDDYQSRPIIRRRRGVDYNHRQGQPIEVAADSEYTRA